MHTHEREIVRRSVMPAGFDELTAGRLSPLLQRIYAMRGVSGSAELDYALSAMISPDRLGGTQAAAQLLHQVMSQRGRIVIVADFDADGATSCALAIRCLQAMGGENLQFIVPNRFVDGYGLTVEVAHRTLSLQPDLVMSVDNGISSLDGVRLLRERGVSVLITDHHLPGPELPKANVIVNPNNRGEGFPSKHLAGVGVVFYIMIALRGYLRDIGWFAERGVAEPNLADYLDLVALGTVADVVKLDHNNRIMVQQGLARIRAGRCSELISALLKLAGKGPASVRASDLGFIVGPRLNAVGRLDDMSVGIDALVTDSPQKAAETANLLDSLNRERKSIESEMQEQALDELTALELDEQLPAGLCLYQETWHQGVIGILASRIKERYHRPVIAFAESGRDTLKGSARSIAGLHIRDVLESIATGHPQLLSRFGGHAMAAGLELKKADLAEFSHCFDGVVEHCLNGRELKGEILSDGGLAPDQLNISVAEQLALAGPWGQGFPEPLFDDHFVIIHQRTVGGTHAKMRLSRPDGPGQFEAIAFNQSERLPSVEGAMIHAAYRLDINEYLGSRRLQLLIEYFQVIDDVG